MVTSYEVLKIMEEKIPPNGPLNNGEDGTFHVTCILPHFKLDGRET